MTTHKGQLAEVVPDVVAAEMIITQVNLPDTGSAALPLIDLLPAPVLAALDKSEIVSIAAGAASDWRVGDTDATTYRLVLGTNVFNPPVRSWINKFVKSDGAPQPLTVEIFYNPYKSDFDAIAGLT